MAGMMGHLDRDDRRLYVALLVNFVFFGVLLTLTGSTLPRLIRELGWSYTESGAVLSAGSLGYAVSILVVGFLVHRLGARTIMLAGLVAQAVGLALFARHPSPVAAMALNLLVGMGQGCTEVVTNLSVIRLERPGSSRLMNFAHAMFCVGAVLGPAAVGSWLGLMSAPDTPWRALYPAAAVVVLIMLVPLARARYRVEPEPAARGVGGAGVPPLLSLFALMLFLYVASEIGLSSWAPEYFVKIRGMVPSVGALMVSAMWLGVLSGRLALSLWYTGHRQDLAIILLSVASGLAVILLTSVKSVPLAVAGVAAAGLGYSGVYPMVMTLVGRWFPTGRAVSVAAAGGGAGSFVFPFVMGWLGESLGIGSSLLLCAAASGLLAILGLAVTALRPRRAPGTLGA